MSTDPTPPQGDLEAELDGAMAPADPPEAPDNTDLGTETPAQAPREKPGLNAGDVETQQEAENPEERDSYT